MFPLWVLAFMPTFLLLCSALLKFQIMDFSGTTLCLSMIFLAFIFEQSLFSYSRKILPLFFFTNVSSMLKVENRNLEIIGNFFGETWIWLSLKYIQLYDIPIIAFSLRFHQPPPHFVHQTFPFAGKAPESTAARWRHLTTKPWQRH